MKITHDGQGSGSEEMQPIDELMKSEVRKQGRVRMLEENKESKQKERRAQRNAVRWSVERSGQRVRIRV